MDLDQVTSDEAADLIKKLELRKAERLQKNLT
jgi:hypothetical protein